MLAALDNFGRACRELANTDFDIHKAKYDGDCFGSWFIDLSAKNVALHRIIWDARDRLLIVQTNRGKDDWLDKWIGREPEQQTLERALAEVRN